MVWYVKGGTCSRDSFLKIYKIFIVNKQPVKDTEKKKRKNGLGAGVEAE